MTSTTSAEARQKVWDMIGDIKIAMLTTRDQSDQLHARPMAAMQKDFDGTLWFMTKEGSSKLDEAAEVSLTYANPSKQEYVSITGRARISHDKAKIKELWSEAARVWFPQGPDEPDIALIAVDVDTAEYWDSPSSAVVYLYGYAKARVTGKPPGANELGENKTVRF
jgi:general stress protein 26